MFLRLLMKQAAQYIMGTFSHHSYASSHRMGLGAVLLLVKGHLNEEMPRYLYQRLRHGLPIHYPLMYQLPTQHPYKDIIEMLRWAKKGVTDESSWKFQIEMQKEIFVQVQ